MAADQRRALTDRQGSEGGEPNCGPPKIVQKIKGLERVERAMEIRAFALKLLRKQGRWTMLYHGPEVLRFEDSRFPMIFYVKPRVPLELRERYHSGPYGWGLYGLEPLEKADRKSPEYKLGHRRDGAEDRHLQAR